MFGCEKTSLDMESLQGRSITIQADSCDAQYDRRIRRSEKCLETFLGEQQGIEDWKFRLARITNGALHGIALKSFGSRQARMECD